MATTSSALGSALSELGAPLPHQLIQPEHRQVEAKCGARQQVDAQRNGRSDEHAERNAEGSESRSTCDPQYLQAGRVEPGWSADEVEVAPEGGGLRGRREADHL